jgi:hypothetical protein
MQLTRSKKVKDKAVLLEKNHILQYAKICNGVDEAFRGRRIGTIDHVRSF